MTPHSGSIARAAGIVGALALLAGGVALWARPRLFPSPIEQARDAYGRRDWPTASLRAFAILKGAPDDPEALRVLARASGRMGRDETVRSIYKRPGIAPLSAEDYLIIAGGFGRRGDLASALTLLEKGHDLDPEHADILHDLSRYCASVDRLKRAEDLAARLALQAGQEARAGVLLGAIRDQLSDPSGAVEALEAALRIDPTIRDLDPGPIQARKLLARNDLKLGRPGPARDQLRRVLGLGLDPEASWLLGRSWLLEGRPAEAASALAEAGDYGRDRPLDPEPAPLVGSLGCAECHRAIHRTQQSSRHARTFLAGPDLARLPVPTGSLADPADPRSIEHRATRDGDRVGWQTRAGGEWASVVLRYAFGSGDRGVTPVGIDRGGHPREMRLSHYGEAGGWDLTAGHPAKPDPATADGALGRTLSADDLRNCLGCHTTSPLAARDRAGPTGREGGIGCERCHGPGGGHLKAVEVGFADLAIARPRLATAERVTALCAECHRPTTRKVRPSDPDAARFQGETLTWSRCYQESRGRLGCVTCHDPHADASRSATFYEAKCLNCHSNSIDPAKAGPGAPPDPSEAGRGAACPVNPSSGCVSCHMPPADAAVPHTTFADHNIRVHRPAAPAR